MNVLIRDVLNYSQLMTGNESYLGVNLNDVINNVISDFDLLIEQKNAIIKFQSLPTLHGIPIQIAQLL